MKIRAVGFDYGGVVGGIAKQKGSFTERVARVIGVGVEEFRRVYFEINHLVNTGKVESWREFDQELLARLKKSEKLEALAAYREQAWGDWVVTDERMVKLVMEVKGRGYKTGCLTNSTRESGRRLREVGVDRLFDVFVASAEEGLQKPDLRLFEIFAKKLGVRMEELIFIDDSTRSLSTAGELGYTPILYRRYEELVMELEKLGVLEKTGKTG